MGWWWVVLAFGCEDPVVTYDGTTFSATFCTEGAAYAGVTLRRASDAFHFDLPAVETQGAETVTVRGEVGPGFVQYAVATWEEQSACEGNHPRHGCQTHGYLLRDEVYTYPRELYGYEGSHPFADIGPIQVSVLDAGGGALLVEQMLQYLPTVSFDAVPGGQANTPRTEIEILYRARWDRARAWKLASLLQQKELGFRWTVKHWPEAPEAFVIAAGGV